MTVLEVLTAATGYLDKQGVESPRLNAEHLLSHVLGKKRLDLYLEFDRPLSDAERAPLRDLVRERGAGRPLQHLLGTAEFYGRSFLCDARALVPRPETEQLVELVLASQSLVRRSLGEGGSTLNSPQVLDAGTGSGVIAITLALEVPSASVTATDISPDALALARENAGRLNAAVAFQEADLLPLGDEAFDLIVANLPYIPTGELADLQREVQHDPRTALDGGPEGIASIEKLATAAPARLRSGGLLALEIGLGQGPRIRAILGANKFRDIRIHTDYQGAERYVLAVYG